MTHITWKPMGNEISSVPKKLVEDSTKRTGTIHALLLTILEEEIADGRGHHICADPSLINQSSCQYRLATPGTG